LNVNATDPILEVRDLKVTFGDRTVIDGISFDVREREIFVVMGPSGCGKTTVLKSIVGLLTPDGGEIRFRGESLNAAGARDRFRRRIGMVFQQGALLNSVSLFENVALPIREHTDLPEWMIERVVSMKLAQVGLLEAGHRLPMELSGGMRKRGGIARALALEPEVLFFDEPTGGLDPVTADGIDNLLLTLRRQLGVTMVVVTHELPSIFKIADRILMLKDGHIATLDDRDAVRETSDRDVRRFVEREAESEEGQADTFLARTEGGES
jgi:phospholipid/cholesterol/gamma-HCH transport system ATP-binding protein